MAMVINTNVAAENATRVLNQTSLEQSQAMERLTSGKRINSAADDAAGMAISTKMTSQIAGTDQAIRNANDGMSMVQTMDGAVDEVVNMMQRMRELGVQAMNGNYTDANRTQMDTEFDQLKLEIDRVAQTTTFNDQQLLNGSASSNSLGRQFHIGWQAGDNNKVSVSALNFGVSALSGGGGFVISSLSLANSVSAASVAVSEIDGALSTINLQRASWGAVQNRLESTVSNLSNVNENMQDSRSAILDADFAQESAALAKTQVLQQAGMSMLSQANQQSQNVLSLLR